MAEHIPNTKQELVELVPVRIMATRPGICWIWT
jgi:hypothetical protein